MAITNKFRVTFDVTHTLDTETQEQLADVILETARFLSGTNPINHWSSRGFAEAIMVEALNGGPEAAAAFLVKSGLREHLREKLKEDGFKFSPATVREVK